MYSLIFSYNNSNDIISTFFSLILRNLFNLLFSYLNSKIKFIHLNMILFYLIIGLVCSMDLNLKNFITHF